MQYNTFKHRIFNCNVFKNTNHDFKVKKKKNAMYLSYADLDHTCRNPTRHDVIDFGTPRSAVFLLSVCPFSKPSTARVGMLLFISQAMKADQACIVIFREKTAFRRYMICLFHVLDRLGSLKSFLNFDVCVVR